MVFVMLVLNGCTSLLELDKESAPQKSAAGFIEKKDGTIIKGTSVTFPEPEKIDFSTIDFLKRRTRDDDWIAVDGQKIPLKDIYGFQENNVFRAVHENYLLTRLEKGKLNLYSFERDKPGLSGSNMFKETAYVYEKVRGRFVLIDERLDLFYAAIEDNKEATALCKELFPYLRMPQMKSSEEKLKQVVALYNK
jgi:hypothetical protein